MASTSHEVQSIIIAPSENSPSVHVLSDSSSESEENIWIGIRDTSSTLLARVDLTTYLIDQIELTATFWILLSKRDFY
ncbi:hypothetical protein NPIL_574911 [Nephila pilipes]|uniref:Uncharacterized protein n=1 Tax=Nephila pilipes TaxID=299642 RepID=A0A8X6M8T0_NEPPI|nr:hypothetical protein NPIL_574911 [Nephila pilipes]